MLKKSSTIIVTLSLLGLLFAVTYTTGIKVTAKQTISLQNLHPDVILLNKAMIGDTDAVRRMLQDGVDPNTPPGPHDRGMTALIFASWEGHTDIIKLLLRARANVDAVSNSGATALMFAAHGGHTDTVRELLNSNANPNIQAPDGMTALSLAINNNHVNIIKLLGKKGKALQLRTNQGLTTPLMRAVKQGNLETVDAVLEANPNLEARDKFGQSALMFAVDRGNIEIVTRLLDKDANPNATDAKGAGVLRRAIALNHTEIVQLLQQRGAQ